MKIPHLPTTIPKNTVLARDCSVQNNCRTALLRFFDEHDPSNLKNPISRRLLDMIDSGDLDDESKQELTKVFIHSPPPPLISHIKARKLSEYKKPINDPAELLKHRYLCKGGGLLLVGATGLGKSSLTMQLAIKWALGQSCFGLEPAKPIKSLIIQAENDEGDLGEMKDGVFNGVNLSEEDQARAADNIHIYSENEKVGIELFEQTITPLLNDVKPDLLWIDPALSYIGGDMNSQEAVGKFLRNQLNPVLTKHQCGGVVIHHTNKPIVFNPSQPSFDPAYLGAGSAEWANWARAVLALRKTDVENLFELIAAKRGTRLKWKSADGESLAFKRYIGYCKRPDTICWVEMAIADAEELKANNGKNAADVLKHVPAVGLIAKDDLISQCRKHGLSRNMTVELLNQILADDQLFEVPVPRPGKRPKVLLSREPVTLSPNLILDALTQNSQGHYILPAPTEPTRKTCESDPPIHPPTDISSGTNPNSNG